jgi:hypothetical protein
LAESAGDMNGVQSEEGRCAMIAMLGTRLSPAS